MGQTPDRDDPRTEPRADGATADQGYESISGTRARYRRIRRLGADELEGLRPRERLVGGLARLLPQFTFNRLRTALWRAAKLNIGVGSLLMGDLILSGAGDWSELLSIGDWTYITGPLRINLGGSVRIGNSVNVGHDCLFITVDHEIGLPSRRAGVSAVRPIVVEDGVWIASAVTLLPGVTIGKGAVVAAGAVVTTSVSPNTMVGGVPARLIRKLNT